MYFEAFFVKNSSFFEILRVFPIHNLLFDFNMICNLQFINAVYPENAFYLFRSLCYYNLPYFPEYNESILW
jgi:hypothetical protein